MSGMSGIYRNAMIAALVIFSSLYLLAQSPSSLPEWSVVNSEEDSVLFLEIPAQLKETPQAQGDLKFLVMKLDPSWSPEWKQAAFELKSLIVAVKTAGPNVRVGLEGRESQVNALMAHELAAYVDGYVFEEAPFIPDADETGRLWEKTKVKDTEVLTALVDAAALGIEVVLFKDMSLSEAHVSFLNAVAQTPTDPLDIQPEVENLPPENAQFFYQPSTGDYHLAVYAPLGKVTPLMFDLSKDTTVAAIYPDSADFKHLQYGKRTEIQLSGKNPYYFFKLTPGEKAGPVETLKIVEKETVDPYELVVKNQVFKDREMKKFRSLVVDENQNYRYNTPTGVAFDITYEDTVYIRPGQPVDRVRREMYLGGVKWRKNKMPELPLIQPEKVQQAPLDIDLDKSYRYTYKGAETLDGHPTWKVRFEPKEQGDYFSGTVWIDQKTGAHRKLKALQSGLEAPVVGNEITAFFDWVEDGGVRYWTQVKENNLQIITVAGVRLNLQITAFRSNYRFNTEDIEEALEKEYKSDRVILRDTDDGFRYLSKKGDKRVLNEKVFAKQKAVLGGVFYDPAQDSPTPLAGFNYTNLDFLKRGWQANFFIAGAVNDLIVSNPDFLGKGWDLTGELFLSAIKFSDRVFEGGEERKELELRSLQESANITLGIPLNSFFRFSLNYSLRSLNWDEGDDLLEEYVLPQDTLEHVGRFTLQYSRERFSTELQYEVVNRADWEAFGLPDDPEPVEDTYSSLSWDVSVSKRLPKFQSLEADFRYLKGWNQDRFSRFGFGFFENRVSGFGTSGAEGDEAVRLRFEYAKGVKGLFNVDVSLDGARAWMDQVNDAGVVEREGVNLVGLGLAANFLGPWDMLIRVDVGYGIHADLEGEDGNLAGQIVFLKLL